MAVGLAQDLVPKAPGVPTPGIHTPGPGDLASPGADSLAPLQIREEIDKFGIHVYQFPECDSDEDEDFKQQDRELKVSVPSSGRGGSQSPVHMAPGGDRVPKSHVGVQQRSVAWAVESLRLARED